MSTTHFLTLRDLTSDQMRSLISRAQELKAMQKSGTPHELLKNKMLAMIFDKSSTRTRASFEAGMTQLGGNSMFLSPRDTQLGRGEPIEDTARVLSRMVDGVVIRTHEHEMVETFARNSQVPVINALTNLYHPCQLLADVQTIQERKNNVQDLKVAWLGDGNNVCHSWMNAASLMDFKLVVATPRGYEPDAKILEQCKNNVTVTQDPNETAFEADVVVTDTWASMGQESELAEREKAFAPFCVNADIMKKAKADAIFMHCLPAYRGKEVTAEVIDGPQSVVWDEAENRLHAQKALLEWLLSK